MTNLEAKTNVMNTANKLLQNEVMSLRNEVAQLKLQLLAHKDCPVTLAMCQQQHVTMNSSNYLCYCSLEIKHLIIHKMHFFIFY